MGFAGYCNLRVVVVEGASVEGLFGAGVVGLVVAVDVPELSRRI